MERMDRQLFGDGGYDADVLILQGDKGVRVAGRGAA